MEKKIEGGRRYYTYCGSITDGNSKGGGDTENDCNLLLLTTRKDSDTNNNLTNNSLDDNGSGSGSEMDCDELEKIKDNSIIACCY
jgi:hypothetical protein